MRRTVVVAVAALAWFAAVAVATTRAAGEQQRWLTPVDCNCSSDAQLPPAAEPEPEAQPEAKAEAEPPACSCGAEPEPEPEAFPETPPESVLLPLGAWPAHYLFWGTLFAVFAIVTAALLVILCIKIKVYRGVTMASANLVLSFVICLSRALVLYIDPYNVRADRRSAPHFAIVLSGLAFPCMNGLVLTMTIATWTLVDAITKTKRIIGDVLYRQRHLFFGILLCQFVFQLTTDLLVAAVRQDPSEDPSLTSAVPALIISCHLFFDLYGLVLAVFKIRLLRNLSDKISEERSKLSNAAQVSEGRRAVFRSLQLVFRMCAIACALHIAYVAGSLSFLSLYATGRLGDAVPFLFLHNVKRCVEAFAIVAHVGYTMYNAKRRLKAMDALQPRRITMAGSIQAPNQSSISSEA